MRRKLVTVLLAALLATSWMVSASAVVITPPSTVTSNDKLYDYLLRLAGIRFLYEEQKFKDPSAAEKLFDDYVKDGMDKEDAATRIPCSSGLDKVTPLLHVPKSCGNAYERLYVELLELRGDLRTHTTKGAEGLADHQKAIELCPKFVEPRVAIALYYLSKKDNARALEEIEKALAVDPKHQDAVMARGLIYQAMGKTALQEESFATGNRLRAEQEYEISVFMSSNNDAPLNPKNAQRLLELRPDSASAIATYAGAINPPRTADAKKYATLAIALAPRQPFGYFARADLNLDLGRFGEAAADAETALRLDPESLDMRVTRALAYLSTNRVKQALDDLNFVISKQPEITDAYTYRSAVYIALGDPKRGLADAKKAVTLDPEYALSYNNLGACYSILNELEKAKGAFETAVRLERKALGYAGPLARFNLGNCYHKLNMIDRANNEYDKAIIADETLALKMFSKCAPATQLGYRDADLRAALASGVLPHIPFIDPERIEDSIALLSRLIVLNPRQSESRFSRANASLCLNRTVPAITDLQRFIRIDSHYRDRSICLLFLAQERSKFTEQGRKELSENIGKINNPAFTALARFLSGEISEAQVLSATAGVADSTIVHLYLAYHYLTAGDRAKAKPHLEWTLLKGNRETVEFVLGVSELERMCGRTLKPPTYTGAISPGRLR